MDRIRSLFSGKTSTEGEYAPLHEEGQVAVAAEEETSFLEGDSVEETPFSWLEYFVFAMLGVAMLWAWNMFMAAAPYFQTRFASDERILSSFQSAILAISTTTNLGVMLLLTKLQRGASYPYRITVALMMNIAIFAILTVSTRLFLSASPTVYLAFLLTTVAFSSWATGLLQNGTFAFAASFGRPEYMQAIMAGQGVAGVLPSLAQMLTVLLLPPSSSPPDATNPGGEQPLPPHREAGTAAFVYFLTAVAISVGALLAFQPLARRYKRMVEARMTATMAESITSVEEAERAGRKVVGLWELSRKLRWVASSVFMCFVVTMFFPVFTTKILSVNVGAAGARTVDLGAGVPRIYRPEVFIPLAFFIWNLGDLLGRMSTMLPFSLRHRPAALFVFAMARWAFIPLYLLCNVGGRGAAVESDLFYLLLVQFPFGLTNGWLGSNSMMAAPEWVDDGEKEAAGGFMVLCLTAGLTVGSALSFSAANV